MNMMTSIKAASSHATISAAISSPEQRWKAALADYCDKLNASAEMPEGADGEDEAIDAYCVAQDYLIEKVPAPGPQELAIKIEMALDRADAFEVTIFDDHADGIASDFCRLTGIDPLRSAAEAWIDRWHALGGNFGMIRNPDSSEARMFRGVAEPSFWTPPTEQNPQLKPHQWILEPAQQVGAVKVLDSLLTLVPGLQDAVFSIAAERLLGGQVVYEQKAG